MNRARKEKKASRPLPSQEKTQIMATRLGRTANSFGKDDDSHWNTIQAEAELYNLSIQRLRLEEEGN